MKRVGLLFSDSDSDGEGGRDAGSRVTRLVATDPLHGRTEGLARPGSFRSSNNGNKCDTKDVSAVTELPDRALHTRRNLESLFAQDTLQAQQGGTTLRYSEQAQLTQNARSVAQAAASAAANYTGHATPTDPNDSSDGDTDARTHCQRGTRGLRSPPPPAATTGSATSTGNPSPLLTVTHASVQAYKGERYTGTCVVALCVPNVRWTSSSASDSTLATDGAPSGRVTALIAVVDASKRALCRARLGASLQLQLSRENPQYVSFYEEDSNGDEQVSSGSTARSERCWTLMFKDRREAVAFVVATRTVLAYSPQASQPAPLATSLIMPAAAASAGAQETVACVRRGSRASFGYRLWLLQPVERRSHYCSIGKTVDEVPAEAPYELRVGDGVWMDGLEKAVVGMRAGEARMALLPPSETRVRRGVGNPEVGPDDTVVAYVLCVDPAGAPARGDRQAKGNGKERSESAASGSASGVSRHSATEEDRQEQSSARQPALRDSGGVAEANTATAAAADVSANDTNTLLQRALAQLVLSSSLPHRGGERAESNGQALGSGSLQTNSPPGGSSTTKAADLSAAVTGALTPTTQLMDRVERATDRIQGQLVSLSERVDRLDIRRAVEENNAVLEKMLRRVVGLAPQGDDAVVEDAQKDREALLATIERYKARYEEANANYQKALEAMGRHVDKVHGLETDLRLQQRTLEDRMAEMREQHRLRLVELELTHREDKGRVAEQKFREGREEGIRAGVKQANDTARNGDDGTVRETNWREKSHAYEQEILRWRTELQEEQGRHLRERRALQGEVDSLQLLCERLGARQDDAALRVPEESSEQQCRRLKRALNAVYANVEGQLAALVARPVFSGSSGATGVGVSTDFEGKVSVQDALSALIVAIKGEAKVYTQEIQTEAVLREQQNDTLRAVRQERREAAAATATAAAPSTHRVSMDTLLVAPNHTAGAPDSGGSDTVVDAGHGEPSAARTGSVAPDSSELEANVAAATGPPRAKDQESEAVREEQRRSTQPFASPLKAPSDLHDSDDKQTSTAERGDEVLARALLAPRASTPLKAGSGDYGDEAVRSGATDEEQHRSSAESDAAAAVASESPSPTQPRATNAAPTTPPASSGSAEGALSYSNGRADDNDRTRHGQSSASDGADCTPVGRLAVRLDYNTDLASPRDQPAGSSAANPAPTAAAERLRARVSWPQASDSETDETPRRGRDSAIPNLMFVARRTADKGPHSNFANL